MIWDHDLRMRERSLRTRHRIEGALFVLVVVAFVVFWVVQGTGGVHGACS